MNNSKEILKKNTMLLVLIFVLLLFQVLITVTGKGTIFGSMILPQNVSNLINQNGYVVILTCGMLLCILTGGNIDLSIGSIVCLVGAIAGKLIVQFKMNVYLSILICLIVGIALGAWQAFWIAYIRIPPFIVTLAGMLTFRGIAWILLDGLTISPFPEEFSKWFNSNISVAEGSAFSTLSLSIAIGAVVCAVIIVLQVFSRINKKRKGYEVDSIAWFIIKLVLISAVLIAVSYLLGQDKGIPVILILLAIIVLFYNYYTSRTVSGRQLYAMGGNEKAARLSGVNTNRTLFFAYTNMGFLSAVAALVAVARFNSAAPSAGTNYEMDAIGACFIGGASAYGGIGTIGGVVIGAVFMGVLNNGMSILGIDSNWQRTVKGLVLLAAVIFDVVSKKRKQNA